MESKFAIQDQGLDTGQAFY